MLLLLPTDIPIVFQLAAQRHQLEHHRQPGEQAALVRQGAASLRHRSHVPESRELQQCRRHGRRASRGGRGVQVHDRLSGQVSDSGWLKKLYFFQQQQQQQQQQLLQQ